MNGRDKRKKRAQRNRDMPPPLRRVGDPFEGLCPNGCGEPGPHFVPPSLGESGFYACTPLDEPDEEPDVDLDNKGRRERELDER